MAFINVLINIVFKNPTISFLCANYNRIIGYQLTHLEISITFVLHYGSFILFNTEWTPPSILLGKLSLYNG